MARSGKPPRPTGRGGTAKWNSPRQPSPHVVVKHRQTSEVAQLLRYTRNATNSALKHEMARPAAGSAEDIKEHRRGTYLAARDHAGRYAEMLAADIASTAARKIDKYLMDRRNDPHAVRPVERDLAARIPGTLCSYDWEAAVLSVKVGSKDRPQTLTFRLNARAVRVLRRRRRGDPVITPDRVVIPYC